MNETFFQRNRNAVITSLLLVLFGLVYAVFSVSSIISAQRFIATTPTAEAEVVNVSRIRRSSNTRRTRVYVTFSVDGKEYAYINAANAASTTKNGDTITIHYNPENPRRVVAAEQSYTNRVLGTAAGFLMAGLGIKRFITVKKSDSERTRD